jgi:hypothetical protein
MVCSAPVLVKGWVTSALLRTDAFIIIETRVLLEIVVELRHVSRTGSAAGGTWRCRAASCCLWAAAQC